MRLLLIRHATAIERGASGMPDELRTLTPEGEKRFRRAAKGLARLAPCPDLILTSPLPRARRTAEIAARAFGCGQIRDIKALAEGDNESLERELEKGGQKVVALVGHEPHLSSLLASILGSSQNERLGFRKGGAALVELTGALKTGGRLLLFAPPRVLRRSARESEA